MPPTQNSRIVPFTMTVNKKFYRPLEQSLIQVEGTKAQDLLHRVSSVNTNNMPANSGKRALFLTGKSEVIAPFFLLRTSDTSFYLSCETVCAPMIMAAFDRMFFRNDPVITESKHICLQLSSYEFAFVEDDAPDEPAPLSIRTLPTTDSTQIQFSLPGTRGELLHFDPSQKDEILKSLAADAFTEESDTNFWEWLRIEAKIPAFEKEWTEKSRALDVGFHTWIDRSKGCYPGAEVVEKSLNLGHPARTLILLEGTSDSQNFTDLPNLFEGEKKVGALTSVAQKGPDIRALGVVRWKDRAPGASFKAVINEANSIVLKQL